MTKDREDVSVARDVSEAMDRMLRYSLRMYQERGERVAMRCVLGDAAALCDALGRGILAAHTSRGTVTKAGRALAAIATKCGDEIWLMRDRIVPQPNPTPTPSSEPV